MKYSVMIEVIANEDIEKAKYIKSPDETVKAVNNMEKIIKSNKWNMGCIPTRSNIWKIQSEWKFYWYG